MFSIFENSIHFLILCIVWKNETSLPSGGPSLPDPLRGRVIAFKWPGRPPPEKNSGDATERRLVGLEEDLGQILEQYHHQWKMQILIFDKMLIYNFLFFWSNGEQI